MGKTNLILLLAILFSCTLTGQTYSGKVTDCNTRNPIANAEVYFQWIDQRTTTDNSGQFSFTTGIDDNSKPDYEVSIVNNQIRWSATKGIDIRILSFQGQETGFHLRSVTGSGQRSLSGLADGMYLVIIISDGKQDVIKIVIAQGAGYYSSNAKFSDKVSTKSAAMESDTIIISKTGYFTQKYVYSQSGSEYELLSTH